jgi:hypothetical protein
MSTISAADKTADDWEAIAAEIVADDPYAHLRSIHNCRTLYDFSRPWVTHCSVQRTELFTSSAAAQKLREKFGRPVIFDEVGYEGNLNYFWGNLSGQEMVRLFWAAAIRGGYCGHGETFIPEGSGTGGTAGLKLWWSHGGELHGESAPRLAFLSKILAQVPGHGLRAADPAKFGLGRWQGNAATAEDPAYRDRFFLFYTDRFRPAFARFDFGPDRTYHAEIIDAWNMTVRDAGTFRGLFYLDLPSKPFMAVRITEADKPVPDLRTQNADTRIRIWTWTRCCRKRYRIPGSNGSCSTTIRPASRQCTMSRSIPTGRRRASGRGCTPRNRCFSS